MSQDKKPKLTDRQKKKLYREAFFLLDEVERLLKLARIKHEEYLAKKNASVAQ